MVGIVLNYSIMDVYYDYRGSSLKEEHQSYKGESTYDIVVAADTIYIIDTFPCLIKTLKDLTNSSSVIYLSHELRKQSELNFYVQAKEAGFTVKQVRNIHFHSPCDSITILHFFVF